jgi:hypothetical protein
VGGGGPTSAQGHGWRGGGDNLFFVSILKTGQGGGAVAAS